MNKIKEKHDIERIIPMIVSNGRTFMQKIKKSLMEPRSFHWFLKLGGLVFDVYGGGTPWSFRDSKLHVH